MNKKESNIILSNYKRIYLAELQGYDKKEVIREYTFLLDNLNMMENRYIIENEAIAEYAGYNYMTRTTFIELFEIFIKYNRYINFDIEEIENVFDDLQYELTEELIKCCKAKIRIIKENL